MKRFTLLMALAATLVGSRPARALDVRLQFWLKWDGMVPPPPALEVMTETKGAYAVEYSLDRRQWTPWVTNEASLPGRYSFSLPAATLGKLAMFFRARRVADRPAAGVQVVVDPARSVSALITPQAGGRLALTNASGTRYLFEVGATNVLEPVLVTMTEVREFAAFPATNSMRTAVVFEPDGLAFHGGGRLTIAFPTNVPHLKLSSFTFSGLDNRFGFVPDRVSSNAVVIPVTHFSGAGTALWEPSEWNRAAMIEANNAMAVAQKEMASVLQAERQRQLLGEPSGLDVAGLIREASRKHFETQLKPLFAAAASDCGLARFLIRELLSLERQLQLLGYEDQFISLSPDDPNFRGWMCNCVKEANDACQAGTISSANYVQAVVGIERMAQLMGYSAWEACGLGDFSDLLVGLQQQKAPCAPEWIGSLSYREEGHADYAWTQADVLLPGYMDDRVVRLERYTTASQTFALDGEVVGADLIRRVQVTPLLDEETWRVRFRCNVQGRVDQQGRLIGDFKNLPLAITGQCAAGTVTAPWGATAMVWQQTQLQARTNATTQVELDVTLRAGVPVAAALVRSTNGFDSFAMPLTGHFERRWARPTCLDDTKRNLWNADISDHVADELADNGDDHSIVFSLPNLYPSQCPNKSSATLHVDLLRPPMPTSALRLDADGSIHGTGSIQGRRPNMALDAWGVLGLGTEWDLFTFLLWDSPEGPGCDLNFGYTVDQAPTTLWIYRDGKMLSQGRRDNPARYLPVQSSLTFSIRKKSP